MLIDHHCHLDFPDFADDLDGVVGAGGGGRRRADGDDLDAHPALRPDPGHRRALRQRVLLGRHASALCARGTGRPGRGDRAAGAAPQGGGDRRGGARLLLRQQPDARRRPRASATTSRRRGRRSCRSSSTRAMPTRTPPPSWRRRWPRAPSRPCCTATRAGPTWPGAGWRSGSTCRSPASSPSRNPMRCARSPPTCRSTGCWWRPTRPTWRPASSAASATSRPTSPSRRRSSPSVKGVSQAELARATTENFFRLYSKTPRTAVAA